MCSNNMYIKVTALNILCNFIKYNYRIIHFRLFFILIIVFVRNEIYILETDEYLMGFNTNTKHCGYVEIIPF